MPSSKPSSIVAGQMSRRLYASSSGGNSLSSKAQSSSANTVFLAKCQEAIRSKRAHFPAKMPPSCANTQKTLIPFYTSPRKNSSLSVSLPTSIFDDSNNVRSRFDREQRLEIELWVKAAYLHEYQMKKGQAAQMQLRPFVEEFTKSGKCDPYLSFYLEKHRKELMPIVRELMLRRNDVLRHQTFGAVEEKSLQHDNDELFLVSAESTQEGAGSSGAVLQRVTIDDLKTAVKRIQSAQTPEEQTLAVQQYMNLRSKYVDNSSEDNQTHSHLTASEAHQKRVQAQIRSLFDEIVVKKRDPTELAERIRALKVNYQRLQRMSLPTEEIDLFDVYALEKTMMDPSAAAKRFIQKARKSPSPQDVEMKKHLLEFLNQEESKIQSSLSTEKHQKLRDAYLKTLEERDILERLNVFNKSRLHVAFRDFIQHHDTFIQGALDILGEENKEFAQLFDVLRQLYEEKKRVTQSVESPFRHPSKADEAFNGVNLSTLDVNAESDKYESTRTSQLKFLEDHYRRCNKILSKNNYQTQYLEQLEILAQRVNSNPTLSAAVRELSDIAQDVASMQGIRDYKQAVGTKDSFVQDLTYLSHLGELSKHVKRINSLESVFGVRAIDKSLELLDTYNIALEPPRYRRYIQSSMPSYKLRYMDTYSAHPIQKERHTDRKVQLICSKSALQQKLSPQALDRFINISGHHYTATKTELLLSSEIFPTREENRQYVVNLLGALVREAQKADLHSDFMIPPQPEKLTPLERLAFQYPSLDQEDAQSHELLSQWVGYFRKGKIAGADEMYGEGLEHQKGIEFEGSASQQEQSNAEGTEELSREDFEALFEKIQSGDNEANAQDVVVQEIEVAADGQSTTKAVSRTSKLISKLKRRRVSKKKKSRSAPEQV
mmetsp:Transcript_774/g.2596  ORF Transcript_774/g.2596 Transcript_774/m.2596 type:complete len:886 (-) Transcript_774:77-2734(-)